LPKKHYQEKIAMNGVKNLRALTAALAVLFLLNSCTDFFTTSWGEMFKRDPKNVKVTSSNVYDLLEAATGDRELSRAILDKINADSDDSLKRAAIKAAGQASGLTTVVMENVKDLIDAAGAKGDPGKALKEVAQQIINDIRNNDIEGIGAEVTKILEGTIEIKSSNLPVPSEQPKAALIKAGKITVSVPKATGTGVGKDTVAITVDSNGKGFVTIAVDGVVKTYSNCEITGDTIILPGAGDNGGNVAIGYGINDDDRTVTLTNLDKIANAGLADTSNPSPENTIPPGKPEFKGDFIDDSVRDSDLTLLAMTLILAKAEKERGADGTLDSYLDTWMNKNVETGKGLDLEEQLIAAVVNKMVERGEDTSELTNMIKDLLGLK
jgi:hypothetical protein